MALHMKKNQTKPNQKKQTLLLCNFWSLDVQILCYWTSQLYWTVDKLWRKNVLRVLVTWTLLITQELCENKLLKNRRVFKGCITEYFTTKAHLGNSLKILIDRCRNTGFVWCSRARRVQAITCGPLSTHYWVIDESI